MDKKTLTLNGKTVEFEPGQTILEVARSHGVFIPTLCYLDGCVATGACRVCVVEVAGARALVASCSTPAEQGMDIQTESERVITSRRLTVELLMAS
ncbi:MAG TPA: 2Fe-2S iron-sulfur cluster-binding protein, partial [Deltaproteobacteria bacterium]|nr:2Fe-2S iron-sulfur cluster-binding protein [Deltaproteobacteria bacterium]